MKKRLLVFLLLIFLIACSVEEDVQTIPEINTTEIDDNSEIKEDKEEIKKEE